MILLAIIVIDVAAFCFYQGYYLIGLISLAGFSSNIGWAALISTSVFLFLEKHWLVGSLPLLLIVWNIFGLKHFHKEKLQPIIRANDSGDIRINFLNYCKDYLSSQTGLSDEQAQILVLDPELGLDIDKAKQQWLCEDLGSGTDPDTFLVSRLYDASEMKRINDILDKYATEYSEREQNIKDYLRSIRHPLGGL